jgi:hypothetical protein
LEFGGTKKRLRPSHTIAIARDVIEIVAIIAAGAWAFYVFIYENRIKPSFAKPDINVTASIQRLGERNGMIAIGLRTDFPQCRHGQSAFFRNGSERLRPADSSQQAGSAFRAYSAYV